MKNEQISSKALTLTGIPNGRDYVFHLPQLNHEQRTLFDLLMSRFFPHKDRADILHEKTVNNGVTFGSTFRIPMNMPVEDIQRIKNALNSANIILEFSLPAETNETVTMIANRRQEYKDRTAAVVAPFEGYYHPDFASASMEKKEAEQTVPVKKAS